MGESLDQKLRRIHVDSLVAQAEAIRDHSDCSERIEQAEIFVRQAMYERTVGRINAHEESRILSLLSFVMPAEWHTAHATPLDKLTNGSAVYRVPTREEYVFNGL